MYQPRLCGFALVVCLLTPAVASAQKLVTAGGQGTSPAVRVFDASGTDQTFLAYPAGFRGGVRVALGDVNGDGVPTSSPARGQAAGRTCAC